MERDKGWWRRCSMAFDDQMRVSFPPNMHYMSILTVSYRTGVKVGIAWLSQLCETQVSQQIEDDGSYEWVSGTGVSSITRDEWKVVAHEVGHGFGKYMQMTMCYFYWHIFFLFLSKGAIHDCTSRMCPCKGECGCCPLSDTVCSAGDTYLMNPTSNVSTNDFSPCSVSDICNTFPNIGYCLKCKFVVGLHVLLSCKLNLEL